jgi:hypothetical protein
MIVPSQHPYPERLDQYHASYQHPMYEAHRQSGFQEPEPIMDHLPFPEESTSPYSCSSDSSSAQSPYASHTGPSHSTISYGRQSHIKTDTIITTPTSSRACDSGEVHSTPVYSPPTYANYTMPTLWSSSLPLLSPKQAKDSHAPNRRHHSIRPKDPRPRRPSSPRPSKTRSLDAKPPLACLFCRGRKIACGPPPPGSDDKTCK